MGPAPISQVRLFNLNPVGEAQKKDRLIKGRSNKLFQKQWKKEQKELR